MSRGLLRAYLMALIAQRAEVVLSQRQGGAMKLAFVGGPLDGDERVVGSKNPRPTFIVTSGLVRGGEEVIRLQAVYELQNVNLPTSVATYQFKGWRDTVTL